MAAAIKKRALQEGVTILLFVDQLEKLFTLASPESGAFLDCISRIGADPASPVRVVMSLRSDFLDRFAALAPGLMAELFRFEIYQTARK